MLRKGFGVWVEKWDCRCEERWLAQSTGVWQFEKLGRSEVVGEGEPEMERRSQRRKDFAGTGFRRKARASILP